MVITGNQKQLNLMNEQETCFTLILTRKSSRKTGFPVRPHGPFLTQDDNHNSHYLTAMATYLADGCLLLGIGKISTERSGSSEVQPRSVVKFLAVILASVN